MRCIYCRFILFSNQQKYYHILLHRIRNATKYQTHDSEYGASNLTYTTQIIYNTLVLITIYTFLVFKVCVPINALPELYSIFIFRSGVLLHNIDMCINENIFCDA